MAEPGERAKQAEAHGDKLDRIMDAMTEGFKAVHDRISKLEDGAHREDRRKRADADDGPTPFEKAGSGEGSKRGELPNGERRQAEQAREAAVDGRRHRADFTRHGEDYGAGGGRDHPNPGREAKVDTAREPDDEDAEFEMDTNHHRADGARALHKFTDEQVTNDHVAQHWNQRAPRPMTGEMLRDYKLRLVRPWQKYSKDFKDVPLATLDSKTFDAIKPKIYADAIAASRSGDGAPGVLRQVTKYDDAGRKFIYWYGDFNSAFQSWRMPVRAISQRQLGHRGQGAAGWAV